MSEKPIEDESSGTEEFPQLDETALQNVQNDEESYEARRAVHSSLFDEEDEPELYFGDDLSDDESGFDRSYAADLSEKIEGSDDYSDPAEQMKRKERRKVTFLVLLILVATIVVSFVAWKIFSGATEKTNIPQPSPTPSISVSEDVGVEEGSPQPLLALFPEAPEVKDGAVTASVVESSIADSNGKAVQIEEAVLTPATTVCEVSHPTDFCLAGRGVSGNVNYDIYYLKDAAHSRMFENPENFKKVQIVGAEAAGVLNLKMGDRVTPTLVAVQSDSSGWMMVFQSGETAEIGAVVQSTSIVEAITE